MTSTPDIIKKLEEIVALEEKATPGPWHTAGTFNPNSDRPTQWVWGPAAPGDQSGECIAQDVTVANARLTVALRNSIPTLKEAVKVIERQNEVIEKKHDALVVAMTWIDNWSPNFTDEEEWKGDEAILRAAIRFNPHAE